MSRTRDNLPVLPARLFSVADFGNTEYPARQSVDEVFDSETGSKFPINRACVDVFLGTSPKPCNGLKRTPYWVAIDATPYDKVASTSTVIDDLFTNHWFGIKFNDVALCKQVWANDLMEFFLTAGRYSLRIYLHSYNYIIMIQTNLNNP